MAGAKRKKKFIAIEDRKTAINKAMALMKPGDALLIAGKDTKTTRYFPQGKYISMTAKLLVKLYL